MPSHRRATITETIHTLRTERDRIAGRLRGLRATFRQVSDLVDSDKPPAEVVEAIRGVLAREASIW